MARKKLLLYSRLAFYPMHWQAFEKICTAHDLEPHIITTDYIDIAPAHKMLGWIDPKAVAEAGGFAPTVHYVSQGSVWHKVWAIFRHLRNIKPDLIWAQEEPTNSFLFPLLLYYQWNRHPRIVAATCENIFSFSRARRLVHTIILARLWRRIDALLASASPSIEAIRAIGMSSHIPTVPLVAGCLSPSTTPAAIQTTLRTDETVVVFGYVGRLCEEKGWKVIIAALRQLPPHIKLLMAADGLQRAGLDAFLVEPALTGRIQNLGFIPKAELWNAYQAMDCLIVPSITTATWKEQFGGVLTDAMVSGIPLIGSSSGAIPEVTGPAGIIVPENDPTELAKAMTLLAGDSALRTKLGTIGKDRFATEFSVPAYARKVAASLLK
ncbi:glycosyltransferase [Patescibacteria group bacterium]|nr:glycosyltransferase [Patescibacteria group bacterium]